MGKKWSLEALTEVARRYRSRKEFENGEGSAYQTARRRGLLDTICEHMTSSREDWTPETIRREATRYKTKAAFRAGSPNAYAAAVRHGMLFQLSDLFEPTATGFGKHIIYRLAFPNAVYIGLTCTPQKRMEQHSKHGVVSRHVASSGFPFPVMEVLHQGLSPEQASNLETEEIRLARKSGLTLLNTAGGGQLGAFGRVRWTKAKVMNVALGFSSRTAFRLGAPGVYAVAVAKGWREAVCAHMKELRRDLSPEEIQRIAQGYPTRGAFQAADFSAYGAARRKGILDHVCQHMTSRRSGR